MSRRGRPSRRLVVGMHPVRELLRSPQPVHEVLIAGGRHDTDVLRDIRRRAQERGVAVRDRAEVPAEAAALVHQGVIAVAPPFPYVALDDVAAAAGDAPAPALLVALDGVTDPHNLGSIARTAEAAGSDGLLLVSRRAAAVTPVAEKAAAGALAHLPVARVPNLVRALAQLAGRGLWAVGLDADAPTEVADVAVLTEPVVLVVGAEGRGLARLTREACDVTCRLPLRGRVASLNASVAAGIALYEVVRRRTVSAASPGTAP